MASPATTAGTPTSAYGPTPPAVLSREHPPAGGGHPAESREPFPYRHGALLVALVAALCFANSLANDLTYDDRGVILRNPLVQEISGLWRAFANTYWPKGMTGGQYRPLVIASFSLDWAIARGGAWWFHLVNVLWHALASALAWRLLRRLVPPAAALAGALLFAVHPVHVEAVSNVVGRAELMMTAFALGALLLHRRGSPWALACFALALLSKENGIVLPGLAVAHDVLFGEGDARSALRRRRRLYAGYAAVAAAYLVLLAAVLQGASRFVAPAATWNGASTADRLLTMATVVPEYVRLLFAPFALSIDYSPGLIELATTFTPVVALGLAIVALAAAATVASWRRAPAVSLALLWFTVAVSPVSNVLFPSGIVLAERTLYLPSLAASLLLAAAVGYLAERGRGRVPVLATAALLVAFAARSWTRTPTWRNNKSLMITVLAERPESYRGHAFAASIHAMRGDWQAADRELAIARRIFQRDGTVYHNAAEAAIELGDLARAGALLDTAVSVHPKYGQAHMLRMVVRYQLGDYRGAVAAAERALEVLPDSARAAHVIAASAGRLGDVDLALRTYRKVVARVAHDPELHERYASVLAEVGDSALARVHADSAARLRARTGVRRSE